MLPKIVDNHYKNSVIMELPDLLYSKRKVMLYGKITQKMAEEVVTQLLCLDETNHDTIVLLINSPGGDVQAGMQIWDVLQLIQSPVITVDMGMAFSMAAILFLAAENRLILPHAQVMIHDIMATGGLEYRKIMESKEALERMLKVREVISQIIADTTGKTLEKIYSLIKYDTYFTAEEALEFSLATRIVSSLDFTLEGGE